MKAKNSEKTPHKKGRAALKSLAVLVFWLAVWQILSFLVHKELLLPAPLLVGQRFCELICTGEFWLIAGASLLRILEGFVCGMLGGVALAILMHFSPLVRALFAPLIKALRATPVASFIILALVWISAIRLPAFISFLMVLPVAWANTQAGISDTDPQLLEMAAAYHLPKITVWRKIYFPSLYPHLISAATTGLGLAWKSGITAEVIVSPRLAIGSELQAAKVYLETTDTFVWTAVVIALSLLLEQLLLRLARRGRKRYEARVKQ